MLLDNQLAKIIGKELAHCLILIKLPTKYLMTLKIEQRKAIVIRIPIMVWLQLCKL